MKNVSEALTDYFKARGITQDAIAERLGVSQQYVSKLLSGKAEFGKKQAQRFGELFGIQPSWLLTGEGEMLAQAQAPVPAQGNTQVIGSNHGTAINGGAQAPASADIQFREYAMRKDAQVDELLSQNGRLIRIIERLTEEKK